MFVITKVTSTCTSFVFYLSICGWWKESRRNYYFNISCQYLVRVCRIGMNLDYFFRSNENEKARSFSCIYLPPTPPNCILRAKPEVRLVLHFSSFFFLIQIVKYKNDSKGKTMFNFYLKNDPPWNCIPRALARGPINLIFLLFSLSRSYISRGKYIRIFVFPC